MILWVFRDDGIGGFLMLKLFSLLDIAMLQVKECVRSLKIPQFIDCVSVHWVSCNYT